MLERKVKQFLHYRFNNTLAKKRRFGRCKHHQQDKELKKNLNALPTQSHYSRQLEGKAFLGPCHENERHRLIQMP